MKSAYNLWDWLWITLFAFGVVLLVVALHLL
jgi:uncharacterized protein YpmS